MASSEPTLAAGDLIACLQSNARKFPDKTAFTYVNDQGEAVDSLTWRELAGEATGLAKYLGSRAPGGSVVLVPTGGGLDFVVAFVGALLADLLPAPVPKTDGRRATADRLRAIRLKSKAFIVISVDEDRVWGVSAPRISTVAPRGRWADPDRLPKAVAADPAFVQFSSGSTGVPKGVLVSHDNVGAQAAEFAEAAEYDSDSVSVTWLPLSHDMGLMTGVLLPLWFGASSVLMEPASFVRNPAVWLRVLSTFNGTHTAGPNFAYDLCVRHVGDEPFSLSSVRMMINGAEAIRPGTVRAFRERFERHGLRDTAACPGYGLAEYTLKAAMSPVSEPPVEFSVDRSSYSSGTIRAAAPGHEGVLLASSGRAQTGTSVLIVEPEHETVLQEDRVGEIWLAGPSVCAGYLEDDVATKQVFVSRTMPGQPARVWLRTGDLGFVHDGELYVTGRIKDLMVINGMNHYPQDLEATAEYDPELKAGRVTAFSTDDRAVVIVAELRSRLASENARRKANEVADRVRMDHGVPLREVVLVAEGQVPRTASGKLERSRCSVAYSKDQLEVLGRSDAVAESIGTGVDVVRVWVADWISARLAVAASEVDMTADPFRYGLDSIGMTQLAADARNRFGRLMPAEAMWSIRSIEDLCQAIHEQLRGGDPLAEL